MFRSGFDSHPLPDKENKMKRSEFLASLLCLPMIGLSKIKKPVIGE